MLGFATSVAEVALAVAFTGFEQGALIPTIVNWISDEAPIRAMGKATGIFPWP